MKPIIWIILLVAGIAIIANLSLDSELNDIQNLQTTVATVAYAGEFNEIKKSVDEFLVLRSMRGTDDGRILAERLDERINNLQLVKMYCIEEISTHDLAFEKNPYQKLQQLCPKLTSVSFSKAIDLFSMI